MQTFRALMFLTLCTGAVAWASSEEKPEAAAASDTTSKETKEFREKSARLQGLEIKIADSNKTITEIVEKKRHAKDEEAVRGFMKELVTVSEERNKMVKEYNSLKQYLLYRFPNLGESVNRRYGVHEEMSAEQLERSSGIDGLLTEVKAVIKEKYAPILKEEAKKEGVPVQERPTPAEEEKEKPLRLVK